MRIIKLLLSAFLVFLVISGIPTPNSFSGIGDGLTDNEKRRLFGQTRKLFENLQGIIKDLKKVNVRLTSIETSDIENLKQTHAEILIQVETLQKLIPAIQGIVELSQAELIQKINNLGANVTQVQSNIETQRQQQAKQQEKFRNGVFTDLGQLRQGMKGDMKTVAALNKRSFDDFSKINSEAFGKIVANLNAQSKKMTEANSALINLLRTELVPTIIVQNEKNLHTLISRLAKSEKKITQNSQTTRNMVAQNFTDMESKNGKMIELLKKHLEEQQMVNQKITVLQENLSKANGNVIMVGSRIEKLQNNVSNRLKVENEKISRIAEVLEVVKNQNNSVGTSLNTLHTSVARLQEITSHAEDNISKQNDVAVKTIEAYSNQLGQKMDHSLVKIGENAANDKLFHEKIDKMIDILQTAANHTVVEEKLDQAILRIETDQANANLTNEKLSKLIKILKTVITAQTGLDVIKNNQNAIKEALTDLRRKANVNISRNNDIKSSIKKIQESTPVFSQ